MMTSTVHEPWLTLAPWSHAQVSNTSHTAACLTQSFNHVKFTSKLHLTLTNQHMPVSDVDPLMDKGDTMIMCTATLA